MSHKHEGHASAHPGASGSSQISPRVTASDRLLSSQVSLPDNPQVAYVIYTPTTDSLSYDVLERGRRHLLSRNNGSPLLESVLPHVYVDGDCSALYAFMVISAESIDTSLFTLRNIPMDGLAVSEASSFGPQGLYPCSSACADQLSPCSACLDPSAPSSSTSCTSSATLLPRKPLRTIYSRFIEAARSRLIDDIVTSFRDAASGTSAQRLMNGFLLTSSRGSSDWSTDWFHAAALRPLLFCRIEVHLSISKLELHSHFQPTDYLPLDINLPLAAGTPITLLPFGVPAYYLSTYSGPTSAVTSQFEESLAGLGAGDWKSHSTTMRTEKQKVPRLNTPQRNGPVYIIAWQAVENKQGEDKGMAIIWPSRLCLSFTAASQSGHGRRPLSHLPDIPAQLQPSPSPPPPPPIYVPVDVPTDGDTLSSPITSVLTGRPIFRRLCGSPTSESLRAFRCLTLSKSSKVDSVASEVGVYVESVAKEREKERERIRRERESAQISASPKAIVTPPTAAPVVSAATSTEALSAAPGATPTVMAGSPQPPAVVPTNANLAAIYPSPPATNGKSSTQSIDSAVTPNAPLPEPPPPSAQPEFGSTPPHSSFNPFESMDTSWTQPSNEFMDLGMGYPMGFDIDVNSITANGGIGNGNTGQMNMEFEDGFTFTEDDFDFFDRPSAIVRPSTAIVPSLEDSSGLTPAAGPAPMGLSPSIFGDGQFSVGVAFTPGHVSSSPFNPGNVDMSTPRYSEMHHTHDVVSTTTDLLPHSGSGTSQLAPTTPQVKLTLEGPRSPPISPNFDPIPFHSTHKLSDSKYDVGKFALPSPPDEEDRTEPIRFPPPVHRKSWKVRYSAATDPRVGVVRKLIGIKRKSFDQGPRRHRSRPSWLQSDEEQDYPVVDDPEDGQSDVASEEEDVDGDDAAPPSRATTPPPAYLPLGPTLLHMQFYHLYLLPLSRPLRPPGSAVAPMAIPLIPTSAPTPVSPAAALGAASEKSKSLEAAGSMIAREVVENRVFAGAWRASKVYSLPHKLSEAWPADVSALAQIIGSVPSLDGPLVLQDIFNSGAAADNKPDRLQRLEAPMFSVGKGGCIIRALPSSLRFWEKLGLTPLGGRKDVTAFLFFEDSGLAKQQSAEKWLKKVSGMYSAYQLGSHTAGSHVICSADGILGLRLDSLRKCLVSFLAGLPATQTTFVFYIAIPDSALTLASPLLRQTLSTIKRLQKSRTESPILFQLIPEHLITANDLGAQVTDIENLCFSVYQRILRPVERTMSRKILDTGKDTRGYFRDPSFTLARVPNATVQFSQSGPARTLDVLDRHTLLHVGYKFSSCGKWLLATCVDQRGESFDVGSWLTQDEVEPSAVLQVWNFAAQFVRMANVEWRLVISKLGLMSSNELDAWIHHLSAAMPLCHDLPPFQVILVCVDQNVSWSLIPHHSSHPGEHPTPRRSPGKDSTKSLYVDVTTTTTYAIYPSIRIPLPTPSAYQWANSSFVPDIEGTSPSEAAPILPVSTTILLHTPPKRHNSMYCTLYIHLLHTSKCPGSSLTISDIVTHQDITRNYHELAVLARLHGHVEYPLLPLHLAALEMMHDALRQEDAE